MIAKYLTCVTALGLVWMMACGGKSQTDGLGAAGAQNSAGSTSSSGASSSAGAPSAGAPSAGLCALPEVSGPCDAYAPSFWHNPKSGLCEPFIYGGCQGNENRFATREECIAQCGGGGANWGACQHDGDCVASSVGCCGACEPIRDSDLTALNRAHLADDQHAQCSPGVTCGQCPMTTPDEATSKYFKPVCVSGQCSVLDVRTSAQFTKCGSADDCELRDGVGCCPGCDGTNFLAVNKTANFCDAPQGCDACLSFPPKSIGVACSAGACIRVDSSTAPPPR
ncbi:MAG: BPTI/Kunitz domain-containing protein [Polyangiaceae bacterium]